jgi:hypothetical protein
MDLLHMALIQAWSKNNKNVKKISKTRNLKMTVHALSSSTNTEKLSVSTVLSSFKSLCDLLSASLPLILCKSASLKANDAQKAR